MKTRFAVVVMVAALLAITLGSAWAGTVSSGLTGVAISDTIVGSQHWYEFTLYNLSNMSNPSWDVLVGGLKVFGNDPAPGSSIDPFATVAPTGWSWNHINGWSNDQIIGQADGANYLAPPQIAPGGNLGGFVLKFNGAYDLGDALIDKFDFEVHVFEVNPTPLSINNGVAEYAESNISGYGQPGSSDATWWDAPQTTDEEIPPWDNPVIPEASSVMLGMMGMAGPIGYALMKKRAAR